METNNYVNQQKPDMELAYKEKPTLHDQLELAKVLRKLKGDIFTSGPEQVRREMNQTLAQKGIYARKVQFAEVKFNDKLESAAQMVFEQMFRAAGLAKDAANLVATSDILSNIIDLLLKKFGVTGPVDLKDPAIAKVFEEIVKEASNMLDRALAMDGKAEYKHVRVSGEKGASATVVPLFGDRATKPST
jgi:hypothetical protein